MRVRIVIVGIISVILQGCANYGNFNTQKYTRLRFKGSLVQTSDKVLIPQDSIFCVNEIAADSVIAEISLEDIITFQHEENSQRVVADQIFEMEKTAAQHVIKPSISQIRTKKIVQAKKIHFKKVEEAFGWLLYILGCTFILGGIVAPLFASWIGWWIILIAVTIIFLGTLLMMVGSQKTGSHSEEFNWSGFLAFLFGLICFGITSIIGIIILIV